MTDTAATSRPRSTDRFTDKAWIASELDRARARTLALVDLPDDDQRAQHSRLMSPMVWDLAHIGNYEELWLLRELDGRPATDAALDDLYNAFEHPRWERPSLPLLGPDEARTYDAAVRDEVLALLERVELGGAAGVAPGGRTVPGGERRTRLLEHGFVYGMVLQHEHQHDETLLATRQLMGDRATPPPDAAPAPATPRPVRSRPEMRRIDGGRATIGTADHPWAYDNERCAHDVELAPFLIDTTAVTNAAFAAFVADGGYDDERLWSPAGWTWRQDASLDAPEFWSTDGAGGWTVLRFGDTLPLEDIADQPVQHVCFHEAEAFARWAGKRLPTEAEWEAAAGAPTRWPWGEAEPTDAHANLGQRHSGPAPVGAYPAGDSPDGVEGMIGDVWEWTASDFRPHPGFEAFPYREYSAVFWGSEYKVLKGGSWAADPLAVRIGFRNWDYPIRRQIFCGFRCARDDD